MANFNYLDFFKTPSETDKKLFIKNINNEVVWSLAPFKIFSSIIQNNNIRINFTNNDFILIDFNNVYESKIALANLQSAINFLSDKTPTEIDKDVELYVNNLLTNISTINGNLLPGTNSVYNLGSSLYQWQDLFTDNISFTGDILLNGTTSVFSYFSATSSTALQIPDVGENVTLSVPPKMSWTPMQNLLVYANLIDNYMIDDYVEGDSSAYFIANVDSYDRVTGTLSIIVDYSNGFGVTISGTSSSIVPTYSLWYINITGKNGVDGGSNYFNSASFSRISTTYSLVMSDSRIYMDGGLSLRFTNYNEGSIYSSRQLIRAWDIGGPINNDDTDYERAQISFDLEDTQKSSISLHSFDWTNYPDSTNYELKFTNGEISSLINGNPTGSVINETTLKGTTTFQQTQEVVNSSTSSNPIVYDFNLGSIWYHDDLVSDYDANFINIPTTNNRAITTSIIINQGLTASMINSPIFINGITYSVKWGNGTLPVGNINQTDVIGLTFITYNNVISEVLGQSSTYVV
jgi:hypothetical protein